LVPIAHPLDRRPIDRKLPQILDESCRLSHTCRSSVSTDARQIARVLFEGHHDGLVAAQPLLMRALERLDRALEVSGDDADESGNHGVPALEHVLSARAAGELAMALDHR